MSSRASGIGTGSALRYAISGLANTAAGYAVIFAAMWTGLDPYSSNALGYAVGLILSFVTTKLFVFRAKGRTVGQTWRYAVVFFVSYGLNILSLHLVMESGGSAVIGQLAAGTIYAIAMYLISGWLVFADRWKARGR